MNDALTEKRAKMRTKSREEVEAIFKLAGFTIERMWELSNGYWPDSPHYDDVRCPWWLLQTDRGLIEVGRRKRVIHIQWDAAPMRIVVTADDVTKSPIGVHAWTVEKAVEYMRALHAAP